MSGPPPRGDMPTPEMIAAAMEIIGPRHRDFWEMTPPDELEETIRRVYVAMRQIEETIK